MPEITVVAEVTVVAEITVVAEVTPEILFGSCVIATLLAMIPGHLIGAIETTEVAALVAALVLAKLLPVFAQVALVIPQILRVAEQLLPIVSDFLLVQPDLPTIRPDCLRAGAGPDVLPQVLLVGLQVAQVSLQVLPIPLNVLHIGLDVQTVLLDIPRQWRGLRQRGGGQQCREQERRTADSPKYSRHMSFLLSACVRVLCRIALCGLPHSKLRRLWAEGAMDKNRR